MWTAPTHRPGGVGNLLLASVIAWGRSPQLRTLRLTVANTNETAIRCYERLGFDLAKNLKWRFRCLRGAKRSCDECHELNLVARRSLC